MIAQTSIKPIIGVYDFEIDASMIDPRVPNLHQMNDDLYDQWVTSNRLEYRKALQELKTKITHVTYKQFGDTLETTVNHFISKLPRNFSCVAFVQPGKSQKWVTEIAIKKGLKASAFVCIGEEGANGLEYSLQGVSPKDKRFQHCVIVDDGSYSGNQMANNISAARQILKTKFAVEPVFHVLIPYITNKAIGRISDLKNKGINVKLYYTVVMPHVSEAISPNNLERAMEVLWPHAIKREQLERASSTALYWFDHKVPNSMSFPDVLAKGKVTQPDTADIQDMGFIPSVQPPYKQPEVA